MGEKNLIVNHKEIIYQGIFKDEELFSTINKSLEAKGYIKREKKSEELVTPTGRMLFLELRPYKIMTNYVTLMIKIKVTLDNIIEVKKKINGKNLKFMKGDVSVVFDSWSLTDDQDRWRMKPWVYFLKGIINKFIYTLPLENSFFNQLVGDTVYIYTQVLKLLNSYNGNRPTLTSEENVMKEMKEEIKKEQELIFS